MIIKPKRLNVQQEAPPTSAGPVLRPAIIKARAESILEDDDVLTASLESGKPLMADKLKELISFRALMEADDHQLQSSGKYLKCCCPFHADRTPSFFILEDDTHAKCYGCKWYGDIIKYEVEFHRLDFKKAWWRLNDFIKSSPRTGRKAKRAAKPAKSAEPQLTAKQLEERKKYAERLATDVWIAEEICRKRHDKSGEPWRPAVIQQLAREGSLGWAGDSIAFIYPTGTKYRQWPQGKIEWDCHSVSLWRQHRLQEATHVYLTESETDAITLLHTGVEQRKPGHAVVAAPSATTFKDEWAPLFQGKAVLFCYDNDGAGEKGIQDVAPLLVPYAKEIRFFDWKEVA